MKRRLASALAALLAVGALGSAAHADSRWQIALGKSTKHGSIGIRLGSDDHARRGHGHAHHEHGRHGHSRPQLAKKVWVPGHAETVQRKVWVPGGWREEWVPASYEHRVDSCGRVIRVKTGGYARKVELPGRWEVRTETVWHPGHWEVRRY